ncbi:Uncharacterised protein [Legionella beliardensis]|uniref:Bacterial surface protein 26-residue repeat n=1 Tax=Legionella beliardensis TaxID=91822 RepID=A0A378HZH7_9GAMM|nr:leucine-rich repeat domain-containing protein [Legionella beliardensis]STX27911.1 Uncharacterised protein [Legionella beliardensis]
MKSNADGKTLTRIEESDIIDGSFQIPAEITTIAGCAFFKCRSLQTIIFHAGVKSIGDWAFSECRNLQTVILPAGITTIGFGAFNDCSSLQKVILPTEVMVSGDGALGECSSSQAIILPAGVTTIKNSAFSNCTNLKILLLPVGVTMSGREVFEGCEKLKLMIIDGDDQAEVERIKTLLPERLKNKVTSKSLCVEVIQLQEKQLARILFSPQTNQLYRFFHVDTRYISKVSVENEEQQGLEKTCPTLPEEIFCHINVHGADANRYYQKAKALIGREPWPTTPEALKGYEEKLIKIVNKCIKQAENFQAATEEAQAASPAAPLN